MNIIIISMYPEDEIFLSKEIIYLKNRFNVIFISRERKNYENVTINSGEGIKSYTIDDPHSGKIRWVIHLFFSFFKPEVWKEIAYLFIRKSFKFYSIKKLLVYSATSAIDSEKIVRIIKRNKLSFQDQILFYAYRMNTSALSIIKAGKYFKNARCIARAHGFDLYEYRQVDNYLPFRKKILQELDALYCISSDGKDYINQYEFKHCKVEISRLGTRDYGREAVRNLNAAEHKSTIVSCSRICPIKRVERIVDALSLIDEDIHWIHIGGGDSFEALKKYAQMKLHGKKNVSYELAGNIENSEVIKFYRDHYIDGFVNVSSVEGIPVSIMEASSFGIPIIATNVGGTGEIVKDDYNGYLLPSNYEDELLVAKIIALLKDKSKTDQLRKNARSEWEKNYNEERNYNVFADSLSGLWEN